MIQSLMENESLVSVSDNLNGEEVALIRERFEDALKGPARDAVSRARTAAAICLNCRGTSSSDRPSAGKTTVLRNSGLEFPLAQQPGCRSGGRASAARATTTGGSPIRRC